MTSITESPRLPGRATLRSAKACVGAPRPEDSRELLELLAERLPPVVARKDVERVLGGVIAAQTLNNADAKGEGPEVAYRVGRSVVYRTDSLLAWIASKFEIRRIANIKTL